MQAYSSSVGLEVALLRQAFACLIAYCFEYTGDLLGEYDPVGHSQRAQQVESGGHTPVLAQA